jgi:hypothetical protein
MDERSQPSTEPGPGVPSGPELERLQSALDEAEVQSFPASDPQSSWAGSDRDGLPWWDDEQ